MASIGTMNPEGWRYILNKSTGERYVRYYFFNNQHGHPTGIRFVTEDGALRDFEIVELGNLEWV